MIGKINWVRVAMGTLVVALILNLGGDTAFGLVTEGTVWWIVAFADPVENLLLILVALAVNFVFSLSIVLLYAAIRPRFGPGPKTAVLAGVACWILGYAFPLLWIPGPETGSLLEIGWPWGHAMGPIWFIAAALGGA